MVCAVKNIARPRVYGKEAYFNSETLYDKFLSHLMFINFQHLTNTFEYFCRLHISTVESQVST